MGVMRMQKTFRSNPKPEIDRGTVLTREATYVQGDTKKRELLKTQQN